MDAGIKFLMRMYHAQRNDLPKKIMVYRDGVSEGEFPQVLEHEVTAVRRGCQQAAEEFDFGKSNYRPLITFISVQKRHHTKFFLKTGPSNMQWDNVPSGTYE